MSDSPPAPQMQRILVSSGTAFEAEVGYSRAVRVGPLVVIAGTTAPGADVVTQAREVFRRIESALTEVGAALSDVVRTRMYVTDISYWRDIAAVHREALGDILPVTTMVEVTALIAPDLLVEIEVDAYVASDRPSSANPSSPGR